MKYLTLIAILSFQVNVNETTDYYQAIGVCQVMVHQISPDHVNDTLIKYWHKISIMADVSLHEYHAGCVDLLAMRVKKEEKDDKTVERLEL